MAVFILLILLGGPFPEAAISQDSLLVSFSRIELVKKNDQPAIELAWNVFRKDTSDNQFIDFNPEYVLEYILTINGTPVSPERPLTKKSYVFTDEVGTDRQFECRIQIKNSVSAVDVTESVNNTDEKRYNYATFKIVQSIEARTFPLFEAFLQYFKDFMEYGKILLISFILSTVFVLGLFSFILFSYRLFLKRSNWTSYINKSVVKIEHQFGTSGLHQNIKGPVASVLRVLTNKLKQYEFQNIKENLREQDSYKLYRIEKSIKDQSNNEINCIANRKGKQLYNFFFSVEHFWNFGVIAPFLGLLGTVTGISKAFATVSIVSSLTSFKEILSSLSSGINEALYTTIGGLVVGIVFLGFYYLFTWRLDTINKALDSACDVMIKRI